MLKPTFAGLIALAINIVNFTVPAPWHDEVATLSAINRSWSELFQLFQNIDLVHAFYYIFVKALSFGNYEINTLRFFSQIAFAVTVSFVYLIAKKVGGRTAAWSAAVAFTFLPATTYYSNEARSYSLTAMFSVIAVWLFLKYLDEFKFSFLVWSQISLTFGVLMHFYVGVLSIIITAYIFARHGLSRSEKLLMIVPTIVSVGIFVLALNQKFQVFWLAKTRVTDFFEMIRLVSGMAFLPLENVYWSTVIWVSLIYLVTKLIRLNNPKNPEVKNQTTLILLLAIVPTLLFITISLIEPVWTPRYSFFTLPFIAVLIGITIANQRNSLALGSIFAIASLTVWVNSFWWYHSPDTKDLYPQISEVVKSLKSKPQALWLTQNPDTDRTPQTLIEWQPELFSQMQLIAPGPSKTESDLLFDSTEILDFESGLDGIDSILQIAWICPNAAVDNQEVELQFRGYVSTLKTEWEYKCWRVQTWQLLKP